MGQKQVIFDDFDGSFSLQDFLRWTDRGPTKVKIYHEDRNLCSTHSYATSNQPPWEFYPNAAHVARAGIMRRFTVFETKWVVKPVTSHPPLAAVMTGYASIMERSGDGREMWDEWLDMHHMIPLIKSVVMSESDSESECDFI